MKASEAIPLSPEELVALKGLFQRWILTAYPWYLDSDDEGFAQTAYSLVSQDAKLGVGRRPHPEEIRAGIEATGEKRLD